MYHQFIKTRSSPKTVVLFRQTCHFDVSKTERLEPGTSSRALCGVALELNGQRALEATVGGGWWVGGLGEICFYCRSFFGGYMIEKKEIQCLSYKVIRSNVYWNWLKPPAIYKRCCERMFRRAVMTHVSYMSGCLEMRETSNIHNSKQFWFGWKPLNFWHARPLEKIM